MCLSSRGAGEVGCVCWKVQRAAAPAEHSPGPTLGSLPEDEPGAPLRDAGFASSGCREMEMAPAGLA